MRGSTSVIYCVHELMYGHVGAVLLHGRANSPWAYSHGYMNI